MECQTNYSVSSQLGNIFKLGNILFGQVKSTKLKGLFTTIVRVSLATSFAILKAGLEANSSLDPTFEIDKNRW